MSVTYDFVEIVCKIKTPGIDFPINIIAKERQKRY